MQPLSLSEISHVIALATAPAFLLGGIVSFLALLSNRMTAIVDRVRMLDAVDEADEKRAELKREVPVLRHRARLLHLSMTVSIASGVTTASLVVIAFVGALLDLELELLIAGLFLLSLLAFMAALLLMVHEAVVAFGELGRYR